MTNQNIDLTNTKICIVGLGYVGLPLAHAFSFKYPITGLDIYKARIDELKNAYDRTLELSTEQLKEAIVENVTTVINYDPRVQVTNVSIGQYESGLQIEIDLSYLAYNISENLRLQFDQNAGFLA